ncbi:hypothetical protein GUITHDRAFT_137312 [Guillardia theta CCMP2712]|uniref:Uncharacterized protein n=1 Tax=Guillardia theta (strain CCMP2712) TaxID=905079 RepID=L1JG81_GUITC|nr:hypothetical protein GUITHDRAFT_137312 [Guillardia theta CCMP2712]EKX47528.1 hypothetical protein GUITHDRAFT_137312 [Guillardia theta CCMP2712]|eukprot:XP_005834508.1 hypothetical protein GUITHDRAFT_137312 [Guillardia theta CCMP2712]
MAKLSDGIRGACGSKLKDFLHALSINRFAGFLTGVFACMLTNSLSCIAVILVSFVSADLIEMERCFGILLGACVGSTFISYLVVFKVVDYGLFLIFWGYCITFFGHAIKTKQIGDAVFGLGLLFYSMEIMGNAFSFVKTHEGFLRLLSRMSNPWLGMLVSTLFTGLIQSSGATMSILLQLARQGMLKMDACTGLMLGANVGTCVTGLLAAIGKSRDALRLAVALFLFRLVSALFMLPFVHPFSRLVCYTCSISPHSSAPGDVTIFLASSHTIFNLVLSVFVLPFTDQWALLIRWLIPDNFRDVDGLTTVKLGKASNKKNLHVKRSKSLPTAPRPVASSPQTPPDV